VSTETRRRSWFLVGFAVAALLIAGVLSYFASSSPDGLDSTTLRGCEVVQTEAGEHLEGSCIAQGSTDHHLSSSPFSGYAIHGNGALTGVAGMLGVVAVFVAAGLLFRLIARRHQDP